MQLRSGRSLSSSSKPSATFKPAIENCASSKTASNLRRTTRYYKKVNYAGMDTIEPIDEYDGITNIWQDETIHSDPDWVPEKKLNTSKSDSDSLKAYPIYQFIKNYIDIYDKLKISHQPIDYANKIKAKAYYNDMMRVIIELYSTINEHFDTIYSKSFRLAKTIRNTAVNLKDQLEGIDVRYRLRKHDLSLFRNCIRELNNNITNFDN